MGKDGAMLRVVFAGLAVVALTAGCGGDVDPGATPAGLAQVRFLDQLYNGQIERA